MSIWLVLTFIFGFFFLCSFGLWIVDILWTYVFDKKNDPNGCSNCFWILVWLVTFLLTLGFLITWLFTTGVVHL